MNDRTNTIVGWVLFSLIVGVGSSIVVNELFHAERPEKMGYPIEGVEAEGGEGAAVAEQPIAVYLASANPALGAEVFKKCAACHTATKGGANGVGPNLWGVVGAAHGHRPDYSYSDPVKSKPGTWDWEALSAWLKSPKAYAPGTKMTFPGLSKPEDRANLIAWLNTQSDSPQPLPAAPAATAAAAPGAPAAENAAAPAEGEAAKQPAGHTGG